MEISDLRRRVLQVIDAARKSAAARRAEVESASRSFDVFLARVASPAVHKLATVLRAEGYPCQVATPAGVLRLFSERANDDFIELSLDTDADQPVVLGRVNRVRGRRVFTSERPLAEGRPLDTLSEDDVLEFLLAAIGPLVER